MKVKPEYIENILVKSNSKLNLLNSIEYEILTKRDEKEINKIIAYSLLLNLGFNTTDDKYSENKMISLELSKDDIKLLIEELGESLKSLDSIK